MSVRALALPLTVALLSGFAAAQLRHGNFNINFDPIAVLQSETDIPFRISITDPRNQPLRDATVTLQIETADHDHVKVYKAPAIDVGVYMAKPEFPAPGVWEVEVQARQGDRLSVRTKEYNVPRTAQP